MKSDNDLISASLSSRASSVKDSKPQASEEQCTAASGKQAADYPTVIKFTSTLAHQFTSTLMHYSPSTGFFSAIPTFLG